MNLNELTVKSIKLKEEIDGFAKKSVPLVIECGNYLTTINTELPKGEWMKWCKENAGIFSTSTIRRYRKVYGCSLVNNFEGLTLEEVYIQIGEKTLPIPSKPPADKEKKEESEKPESRFEKFWSLIVKVQDIQYETFNPEELENILIHLKPIVEWYEANN